MITGCVHWTDMSETSERFSKLKIERSDISILCGTTATETTNERKINQRRKGTCRCRCRCTTLTNSDKMLFNFFDSEIDFKNEGDAIDRTKNNCKFNFVHVIIILFQRNE